MSLKINFVGGNGVMGKTHIPLFERAGFEVIVTGRNSNPSMEEAARECDLTLVCVPIENTKEVIKRVAPHSRAIVDFTGLKVFPIKAMLEHSKPETEVAGLHPLYGLVNGVENLRGKTLIYCKTSRSGKTIEKFLDSFRFLDIKVIEMNPEKHDKIVNGTLQNLRVSILGAFMEEILKLGLSFEEIYDLSPPPTKIILEFIARQFNEDNDLLYDSMLENNSFQEEINREFVRKFISGYDNIDKEKIRDFFGSSFNEMQERAKKRLE